MKKLKLVFHNFYTSFAWRVLLGSFFVAVIGGFSWTLWQARAEQQVLIAQVQSGEELAVKLEETAQELEALQNEDQVIRNASLSAEIKSIEAVFAEGSDLFEQRSDLALQGTKVMELDQLLAQFLSLLSRREWREARTQAASIRTKIAALIAASVPKVATPVNAPASNTLPGSGYTRQKVATSRGEFVVSMVVAPGARAIIETAGDSDCGNNCPVKSLAEHVAASGGFAGINGAYFCPPDYAQCQGKVNTFDTLAVNGRSKAVINQANNVYSTVPLVAAYGSSLSFYDQTVQWGADASSGGGLANYPRLLRDGNIANSDENGKGTRGFIGMKDNAIVIGHIYAASFADSAEALKTLGLQNALNLDGGGSTALWFEGGYKAGPGRALPTAIVLVR
jgi:hypothetical protein